MLQNILTDALAEGERQLKPILQNLDPSLFQNIILGILAIFIPFAIVFLTDVLDSKKERSEFEKMVLSIEVLGAKKVFWLSVLGLGVFAFFRGEEVSPPQKLFAIFIALFLIFSLGKSFKKTLRFSEGHETEFEINFLKGLNLSRIFRLGNKLKMERMNRAWNSFWSERSIHDEREFTKIFIEHIDNVLERKRYDVTVLLARAYQNNIDKRDRVSISYELLPRLFEWHEKFWETQQGWQKRINNLDKIQKEEFSSKHFPTFKKWTLSFLKKVYARDNLFWNWDYFQKELFPAVAKTLLFDGLGAYQLFICFKNYIDGAESKLDKIDNEDKKQVWWDYITGLFGSFCPLFFENIDSVSDKHQVWELYFPLDWKVTNANSKNGMSRVILNEFLQWAQKRVFKKDEGDDDKDLTEVVNGIFPNAHRDLFPAFLILLFSTEIKHAIQKRPNFSLTNMSISWSGEKSDQEIQQMLNQRDKSQTEETINIIFDYFRDWRLLNLYKEDITKEELTNWKGFSEEQRKRILDRVRKAKLQGALDELSGTEIMDLCKESEYREDQRKSFFGLIRLLLEHIQ